MKVMHTVCVNCIYFTDVHITAKIITVADFSQFFVNLVCCKEVNSILSLASVWMFAFLHLTFANVSQHK